MNTAVLARASAVGAWDWFHLGTGCTVIQGIELGNQCFLAAGATVVRDAANGQLARGTQTRPFFPRT